MATLDAEIEALLDRCPSFSYIEIVQNIVHTYEQISHRSEFLGLKSALQLRCFSYPCSWKRSIKSISFPSIHWKTDCSRSRLGPPSMSPSRPCNAATAALCIVRCWQPGLKSFSERRMNRTGSRRVGMRSKANLEYNGLIYDFRYRVLPKVS